MFTKWIGPGKTIPAFTLMFGLFTFVMAYVKNFGAAIAVRFSKCIKHTPLERTNLPLTSSHSLFLPCTVLGIAEGAIFPGLAFYLSRFYKKDELGFRLVRTINTGQGYSLVPGC